MKEGFKTRIGYISVWAYALGCAVGWGSFVMPASTFLPEAGPLGTLIGLIIAALFVDIMAICIVYMARRYPDADGLHTYISRAMGADHGFLSAWALILAYLSIMWANATAIILLVRFIWGDVLQWGIYYQVAGYDVYAGEIITTSLIIFFFGFLGIIGRTAVRVMHVVFALLQIFLVIGVFIAVLIHGAPTAPGTFGFSDVEVSGGFQIFNIAMLAPWMFVGFESVTYMINSGGRTVKGFTRIMVLAVIAGCLAYLLPSLIPVVAVPDGYGDWATYIDASKGASGLMGLPIFYSVYATLGEGGLYALIGAVISAICSSMFGLYRVSARLLLRMAEDGLMPGILSKKNKNGEPKNAMIVVMALSLIIPFFGRTAIGWIVDITTISATIVYVYAAVCCAKLAKTDEKYSVPIRIVSYIGMVFSALSALFLLIPNIFSENKLATESYFILAAWSISGLIYYWIIFRRDKKGIYGKSTIMWVVMLFLIFFSSTMWIRQRTAARLAVMIHNDPRLSGFLTTNSMIQMIFAVVALLIMLSLFSTLLTREKETERKATESEARSEAKTAFLFNMSHDIRTPMNAIMGFTDLALLDPGNEEKMVDYLAKIKSSGGHLLSLINDILEMSRIESGKIELAPEVVNLQRLLADAESIMRGQTQAKNQEFSVDASKVKHAYVMVDRLRLNQVIFNLTSNAIKYTQEGGKISIKAAETAKGTDGTSVYEIRVKDNGMGMDQEFADKIFEAFERDKRAEVKGIQGTGLGMAITKSIIDLMGGSIRLVTEVGKGSEFIVSFTLPIATEEQIAESEKKKVDVEEIDLGGRRVLLVDDVEINREIAVAVLEMYGLEVEQAEDGQEALEKVIMAPAKHFDAILMDVQMPRMNGYEATKAIRNLADTEKASIPIIAMTANAFEEDVKNAKAAGMNGHVAKPIDQEKLAEQLYKVLQ